MQKIEYKYEKGIAIVKLLADECWVIPSCAPLLAMFHFLQHILSYFKVLQNHNVLYDLQIVRYAVMLQCWYYYCHYS